MAIRLARFIGVFILVLGAIGLVAPATFVTMVTFFQVPPMLYLAAVIRIAIGVVLVLAAPASRSHAVLSAVGVVIAIGGLITPFMGAAIAKPILDWWATNPLVPRAFGVMAIGIGAFVVRYSRPSPPALHR
jgi:hypothetical protein